MIVASSVSHYNANILLASSGSAIFGSSFVLESLPQWRKDATADGRSREAASTSGHVEMRARSVWKSKQCFRVRAEREPSGRSGDATGEDIASADERLQDLRTELLVQVSERKKLLNSLTQEFGGASKEQTGSPDARKLQQHEAGLQLPTPPWPPGVVSRQPSKPPLSSLQAPPKLPSPPPAIALEAQRQPRPPEMVVAPEKVKRSGLDKAVEKRPPLAGTNVMNVILVAAECAPWSKTGGLADVAGALPKALARRGHRVMTVSPRYSNYAEAWETGVRKTYNVAGQDMEVGYFHAYIDGVDFVFVDSPLFHTCSSDIYGGSREDVLIRMILLCKAAVEIPWLVPCGGVCYGDGNLVFIANDWHTALLPVYLQAYYRDKQLMQFTRSVLVIHNIAHQGRGPLAEFGKLGLPEHYRDTFALYDPIGGEHMNILMAGLLTAHRIVAVSHGYAWECQTQEGGWGLDKTMRDNSWKLKGVVNGIDDGEWNPDVDPFLKSDGYCNYNIETLTKGKPACKAALQKELGLPIRSDVPLLGFIGRLDYQKGVDIIADSMPWMMGQDLQLVMLGTGRDDLEDMLRSFEGQHRDKVRGWVGFSVQTAHRITAGVDILLMPSRFEPCGLNQLYAMRYGTVPVVHAVGGLRDTVKPFDPFSEQGLGWTFDRADPTELIHAIGNAIWTFKDYKESWLGIQRRGMAQDLSWDHAAQEYEDVLVAAKYQW